MSLPAGFCFVDMDCGPGEYCKNNRCVPLPTPVPTKIRVLEVEPTRPTLEEWEAERKRREIPIGAAEAMLEEERLVLGEPELPEGVTVTEALMVPGIRPGWTREEVAEFYPSPYVTEPEDEIVEKPPLDGVNWWQLLLGIDEMPDKDQIMKGLMVLGAFGALFELVYLLRDM